MHVHGCKVCQKQVKKTALRKQLTARKRKVAVRKRPIGARCVIWKRLAVYSPCNMFDALVRANMVQTMRLAHAPRSRRGLQQSAVVLNVPLSLLLYEDMSYAPVCH